MCILVRTRPKIAHDLSGSCEPWLALVRDMTPVIDSPDLALCLGAEIILLQIPYAVLCFSIRSVSMSHFGIYFQCISPSRVLCSLPLQEQIVTSQSVGVCIQHTCVTNPLFSVHILILAHTNNFWFNINDYINPHMEVIRRLYSCSKQFHKKATCQPQKLSPLC